MILGHWILLGLISYSYGQSLTSSASVVKRPGEPVTLSCTVSGLPLSWLHWIRQKPGQGLEWIGRIDSGTGTIFAQSLQGQFSITKDTDKNMVYLEVKSLKTEDTAVYYCARESHFHCDDYFDYWGKGTQVTVTSATQGPPQSLSTAWQCGPAGSDGLITLGCITKDLSTTDGLSFIWKDSSNQEISTGVVQYPAVQESGGYSAVSHARVKASDWDAKKKFTCEVKNPKGSKSANLQKIDVPQQNAALLLTAPTQKELENGTATFVCLASDFSPKSHSFKWTQDGKPISKVKDTIVSQSNKLYTAISVVQMTSGEWTETVKCTFTQKDFTDSKEAVNGEPIDKTQVKVEITPPSTKDMLLLRSGKLVCSVNDITGLKGIKWLIGEKEIPSLPREILSKTAQITAKINFDEWRNGTKYTCEVEHSGFPQQFERKDFVRETGTTICPKVYVLAPPETSESVTLTCYVKDFYPKEVYVSWLADDKPVEGLSYYKENTTIPQNEKQFSMYSQLIVDSQSWKKGVVYTCRVYHESIEDPVRLISRSIQASSSNPLNLVNLSLNVPSSC
ncbi:Ig heavy chain V region 914, partial [Silurus asotus]